MRETIVLLEDDEAVRDVLAIVLTSNQFRVLEFSNAEEMINKNVGKIDLFLIDNHLSGMDGLQVCKALKDNPQTCLVPILLICTDFSIRRKARDWGANAAIDKPFSRLELLQEIRRVIS